MSTNEAPCCGARNPLDHDFECRFTKSQIDLPEWEDKRAIIDQELAMGQTDEAGQFTAHPERPQYLSRGLAPEAKQVATDLYGAAEAERLLPTFKHIDWCNSNGTYGDPDCTCPDPELPHMDHAGEKVWCLDCDMYVDPTKTHPGTHLDPKNEHRDERPTGVPLTRKQAWFLPSGAQVPLDAVIQLTVRVPIVKAPDDDASRDLVFRTAVDRINADVKRLEGVVGYRIVAIEGAVRPIDCNCAACTWFRDGFGDNVHGRACTNTDGATRVCDHPGCSCDAAMTDGECEACWLWNK